MIRLKFFGVVKDAVGKTYLQVDPEGIDTINDLEQRLFSLHPSME